MTPLIKTFFCLLCVLFNEFRWEDCNIVEAWLYSFTEPVYVKCFKSWVNSWTMVFQICWLMCIILPNSCGVDICSRDRKAECYKSRTQKAPSCGRARSWWCEHWVCSTTMPPCEAPGGCLGFFSAVQDFFQAICSRLQDMAFMQGTEKAWLLYPRSKEAGSFHSEWTNLRSDGYHSKQTWL